MRHFPKVATIGGLAVLTISGGCGFSYQQIQDKMITEFASNHTVAQNAAKRDAIESWNKAAKTNPLMNEKTRPTIISGMYYKEFIDRSDCPYSFDIPADHPCLGNYIGEMFIRFREEELTNLEEEHNNRN